VGVASAATRLHGRGDLNAIQAILAGNGRRGTVVEEFPGGPNLIRRRDYGNAERYCIQGGCWIFVSIENEKTRDNKPKATPVNGQTRGTVVEGFPDRPNLIRRRDYSGAKRCCIPSGFAIQHEGNEESPDPADCSFRRTIILPSAP
jgi:hypothetical protein